jgi:hypothetical protein
LETFLFTADRLNPLTRDFLDRHAHALNLEGASGDRVLRALAIRGGGSFLELYELNRVQANETGLTAIAVTGTLAQYEPLRHHVEPISRVLSIMRQLAESCSALQHYADSGSTKMEDYKVAAIEKIIALWKERNDLLEDLNQTVETLRRSDPMPTSREWSQ